MPPRTQREEVGLEGAEWDAYVVNVVGKRNVLASWSWREDGAAKLARQGCPTAVLWSGVNVEAPSIFLEFELLAREIWVDQIG